MIPFDTMYHFKHLIWPINLKTIITISLAYILCKALIDRYFRQPAWVKFVRTLPGPMEFPIVGSLNSLLMALIVGASKTLVNHVQVYGSTFRLRLGSVLLAVVSDADDVQAITSSSNCLERRSIHKILVNDIGNSLMFTCPAAVWRRKRKEYQPFFNKRNLLTRFQEMVEVSGKYVEKLKKHVDGPEFDLGPYMDDLSLDGMIKTLFNYDITDEERKQISIYQNPTNAFAIIAIHYVLPYSFVRAVLQWFYGINVKEKIRISYDFMEKVMQTQKLPTQSDETEATEIKTLKRETYAQQLIGKSLNLEKELKEPNGAVADMSTWLIAGTEAIATAAAFCFLLLAEHPEIQEKAYQEIYDVFGDDERPVESSDLNKFPYLEQVMKETLRLYPPGSFVPRSATDDMKIGSRFYPTGTEFIINIAGIQRDPDHYPQPNRFNPENFTPEAMNKRHRYSFFAFGAGPRNCIGKDYAEMNILLRLISFLRVFTFQTNVKVEDLKLKFEIIEKSSIGYPVSIKLRRKIS